MSAVLQPLFRFEQESHTYWLNDRELLSVTKILKLCGAVDHRYSNANARERGSAVHMACHFFAEGDLNREQLDHDLDGYVRGYEKFVAESGFKAVACEKPIYHPVYLYGTIPDQIGEVNGKDAVVELKSGAMQDWTALQTAFQAMAIWPKDFLTKIRIGVELHQDGKYQMKRFNDTSDFNVAVGMLAVVNWNLIHGGARDDN